MYSTEGRTMVVLSSAACQTINGAVSSVHKTNVVVSRASFPVFLLNLPGMTYSSTLRC